MKCQKCGIREANNHFTRTENDREEELFLCDKCAREEFSFININPGFDAAIKNLMSGFLGGGISSAPYAAPALVCKKCGMSYSDFARLGKLGCGECYTSFKDKLLIPLKQMHGNDKHTGKIPSRADVRISREREIETLEAQLNHAVMKQEFEKAAVIRDKLKALKNTGGDA